MNPDLYTIHPLADRFPSMPDKDYQDFKEAIRTDGLFHPIVINQENQILDGRHRYLACQELGIEPTFTIYNGSGPIEMFIYDSNIHRRHLTDDQRVMLATEFAPYFRKEGQERKAEGLGKATAASPHTGKATEYVDAESTPRTKRNLKAKEANSTAGKIAAKAGVSIHKARQALAVSKDPELSAQVARREVKLKDAAKSTPPTSWTSPGSSGGTTKTAWQESEELFVRDKFRCFMDRLSEHLPRKKALPILQQCVTEMLAKSVRPIRKASE